MHRMPKPGESLRDFGHEPKRAAHLVGMIAERRKSKMHKAARIGPDLISDFP